MFGHWIVDRPIALSYSFNHIPGIPPVKSVKHTGLVRCILWS